MSQNVSRTNQLATVGTVTVQAINSGVTQQRNMSPNFYAIDWPE